MSVDDPFAEEKDGGDGRQTRWSLLTVKLSLNCSSPSSRMSTNHTCHEHMKNSVSDRMTVKVCTTFLLFSGEEGGRYDIKIELADYLNNHRTNNIVI